MTARVAGGPAAYGHADAGVLEGQGVTDAVAGHRHDVTMALRRRGNRAFLLRGGPPHALGRPGTRGQPAGKAAGVRRAGRRGRSRYAHPRGHRPAARGLSPEITLGPRLGGRKCAWTRRPADPPGQDDQGLRDQDVRQQRHGTRSPPPPSPGISWPGPGQQEHPAKPAASVLPGA